MDEEDLELGSRGGKLPGKQLAHVAPASFFSRNAQHGGIKVAKQQLALTRKRHLTGKVRACSCWLCLMHPTPVPAGAAAASAASVISAPGCCCCCAAPPGRR